MQNAIADATSIAALLQTVVALVVIAVFVMAIVSFIMAIWDLITSKGEEDKKTRGEMRIRYMLIGIVMTIIFLILLPLFLRWVGVLQYQAFTAPSIFARVGEILTYLLGIGGVMQDFMINEQIFNINPANTSASPYRTPYYSL